MKKLKIKLFRHKIYKDVYLKRNWHISGSPEAEWWEATNSIYEALHSMERYEKGKIKIEDIEREYSNFIGRSATYKAKITLEREFDFDGFKGKLKKELILPLEEFELVTLVESEGENERYSF